MYDIALAALLLVGTLAAAAILGVALAAFVQRRSWPYLLVALAVATLLARTTIGMGYMGGWMLPEHHHLLEHGLDVTMAALVIAAVLSAHTMKGAPGGDTS